MPDSTSARILIAFASTAILSSCAAFQEPESVRVIQEADIAGCTFERVEVDRRREVIEVICREDE